MVNSFKGEHAFLSNFYPSRLRCQGLVLPTVEHVYQSCKMTTHRDFLKVATCQTPGQAKRIARKLNMRSDWEQIKDLVMLECLRSKFQYPQLKQFLLATGDDHLEEGNTWGDVYWGTVNGVGENKLGKFLMQVREEVRNA